MTTGESGIVSPARAGGSSTTQTWSNVFSNGCGQPLTAADFWAKLDTAWVCLDCELMPWSAKAQELLRAQYAAVGAAGLASLPSAVMALEQAALDWRGRRRRRLSRWRHGSGSESKTSIGSSRPTASIAGP